MVVLTSPAFPPIRDGLEPQMQEIGKRDARHHGMSVQAGPRSSLQRAEAKVLLELLMRLLAYQRALMGAASVRSDLRGGCLLR